MTIALYRDRAEKYLVKAIGRHFPLEAGKRTLVRQYVNRFLDQKSNSGSCVVNTAAGLRFEVDLNSEIDLHIYLTGWWEKTDCQIALSRLRPGDTFIDVGAHIGFYALQAARVVGSTGHVYAFEPNPTIHPRLINNIALNRMKNVSAWRIALSDYEGSAKLYQPLSGRNGDASLYTSYTREGRAVPLSAFEVTVAPLDVFCSKAGINRVNFIKIDAEGAEPSVLTGARRIIQQHRPTLMVECNAQALSAGKFKLSEFLESLWNLGYDTRQRGRWGRHLKPVRSPADVDPICNLHCLPRSSGLAFPL